MNLVWRKMTQWHYSVEFFLMEAGHTKIHIDIGISTKILCSTALNADLPVPESSYRKLSRKNVVTF